MVSIGVLMLLLVRKYRNGFLYRIRNQGRTFLGFSVLSEGMSQSGYFAGNVAVALAPFVTYVSALGGLQSVFLLGIFLVFPQRPTRVNAVQVFAICMIVVGVFLLEGFK